MKEQFLGIPKMILLGSTGRNSGKTTFATSFISHFSDSVPVYGLKVTTIQEVGGKCPRGGQGCGVCSSLVGKYEILEEKNPNGNKDTSLLLSSGAKKVYWVKVLQNYIYESIVEVIKKIPDDALIVCESNSIRNVVRPGCFIMLNNIEDKSIKQSARKVIDKADIIINSNLDMNFNSVIEKLTIDKKITIKTKEEK